jgi:hypothetical protein
MSDPARQLRSRWGAASPVDNRGRFGSLDSFGR